MWRIETLNSFEHAKQQPVDDFLRDVGIHLDSFLMILEKVAAYIVTEQERSPMKKRGRKSDLSLADQLLLTVRYLRHYPTFARLGKEFGMSESYANKIYHRILDGGNFKRDTTVLPLYSLLHQEEGKLLPDI